MKRQELDNLIRQGKAPGAVMLYGESHFLIEHYTKQLADVEDPNILSVYFDEYQFANAKAHLSQGSLFGGRNVLVIKSEKKLPKNDLTALIGLVQKNPGNLFIYAYFGTDFKKSATAAFGPKSGGADVRLFRPFPNEARQIVLNEAASRGINLDPYAASHLLESQNGDLALTINELDKFSLLQGRIGIKEIDELVYGVAEVKVDQLIDTLLQKQDFVPLMRRLLEHGEDEIRLLTALSNHIAQLYLFYASIRLSGAADSAKILGYKLPPRIEQERSQQSVRFKQPQYTRLMALLGETELQMKSAGGGSKNALLAAAFLKVQSLL
ncbi:DNA polymerase III subunit delta [Sulfurimonas sp. HSL-1656]|uniref:DNA polymerase III subunit delta n=1 Tax=Thiomicrolovo subterrani TaxID=3131934 RepID=UPI0031FA2D8B